MSDKKQETIDKMQTAFEILADIYNNEDLMRISDKKKLDTILGKLENLMISISD